MRPGAVIIWPLYYALLGGQLDSWSVQQCYSFVTLQISSSENALVQVGISIAIHSLIITPILNLKSHPISIFPTPIQMLTYAPRTPFHFPPFPSHLSLHSFPSSLSLTNLHPIQNPCSPLRHRHSSSSHGRIPPNPDSGGRAARARRAMQMNAFLLSTPVVW